LFKRYVPSLLLKQFSVSVDKIQHICEIRFTLVIEGLRLSVALS